jgi:hypothetical protein
VDQLHTTSSLLCIINSTVTEKQTQRRYPLKTAFNSPAPTVTTVQVAIAYETRIIIAQRTAPKTHQHETKAIISHPKQC